MEEGTATTSLWVLDGSAEACKELHRSGGSIKLQCLAAIVTYNRGYSMDFKTIVWK